MFYYFNNRLQGLQTALEWNLVIGDSRKMKHMKADNISLPNNQLNFREF